MACNEASLIDYLKIWDNPTAPIDAVVCPFVGSNGAGVAEPLFVLVIAMGMGLGLSIRTQHPAPTVVAFMLSAGFFATRLPGGAAQVLVVVVLVAIAGAGYVLYTNASRTFG